MLVWLCLEFIGGHDEDALRIVVRHIDDLNVSPRRSLPQFEPGVAASGQILPRTPENFLNLDFRHTVAVDVGLPCVGVQEVANVHGRSS